MSYRLKLLIPFVYFIAALTLFATILSRDEPNNLHFIGMATAVPSFILWIVARIQLGGSFSIAPKAQPLVQSGFYSKLRHPVYYFSITALLGLLIFIQNPVLFLTLPALVALEVWRMRKEEKVLFDKYGQQYQDYKSKTWF